MNTTKADIIREYGPFPDVADIHGVSYDGSRVWFATGHSLCALDPQSGQVVRTFAMAAQAGTAFDGRHLFQFVGDRILKLDPQTGETLADLPAPEGQNSGMAWAEGSLWIGQYAARRIHQVDPETGKILRTIRCDRHVTGITWTDGGLWHGTWEDDASELRHIDPRSGQVLDVIEMPAGMAVSGLEAGDDRFYCGGATSGVLRAVRKPARAKAT
ncbi:Streptogramin lyase [Bordetella ansorpii]|uniref:Streptogramin lyase n=1 Tax=Bordetella ansorpii TaxID=288768 RepID=A0A157NUF5_9BORD|nr:PQQ-binding-like beta-propeller repeat protein [Bordetella ansorpii]SAI24913.1 Streptogramin lyase [Bordetella ansorpii]